ncbi:MAG: DUF4105 domain-containing protein [Polyangiaceae bacterium]|nr:DUF4105 domain-containing protein [Polyangiaceae bacterium]
MRTTTTPNAPPGARGRRAGGRHAAPLALALPALCALPTLLALLAAPRPACAAEPGEELAVSVLTFGPGDHPFFKFGHNAILVHDSKHNTDVVYNYGAFRFDSPWLLVDFFKGRLKYWLATRSLRGTINDYRRENRSIDAQELELSPAQRRAIATALEENAREENKYYKYDYYRDNCSTRVRDAVDAVIGGKIHAAALGPAEMTWRDHTRRLVADDLPVYLGLHVAMGDLIDKPIDVWREMFLPSKVQETLRKVKVPTSAGELPLVKSEKNLLAAARGPLRAAPPRWLLPMLGAGILAGGSLFGLAALGRNLRAARAAFGTLVALLGLVFGFLGTLFFFFWTLTDHEVAYRNENMLQCAPWALAFVVVGFGVARGRAAWLRRAKGLALSVVGASVLGLLCKVLPWFDQNNSEIIALALPLWAGVAAGVITLERALAARSLVPAGVAPAAGGAALVVPGAGDVPLATGEAANRAAVGEALAGAAPIGGPLAVGDATAGSTLLTGHSPDGLAPGHAPLGDGAGKAPAGDLAAVKAPAAEASGKAAGKSIWGRKAPAVATVMETRASEPKPVKWPEVTPKTPEVKAIEGELNVLEGGPKAPSTGGADGADLAGEGLALGNVSERLEAGLPLASELPPVAEGGLANVDENGAVRAADGGGEPVGHGGVAPGGEAGVEKVDEVEKSL